MAGIHLASVGESISFSSGNIATLVVVAVIALGALGVAALLVREVLAAERGHRPDEGDRRRASRRAPPPTSTASSAR